MDRRQRHMIDTQRAAREGKRHHAFYRGYCAFKMNQPGNPYSADGDLFNCWENGWKFAKFRDRSEPLCRLGPGGDYVQDWPEAQS